MVLYARDINFERVSGNERPPVIGVYRVDERRSPPFLPIAGKGKLNTVPRLSSDVYQDPRFLIKGPGDVT